MTVAAGSPGRVRATVGVLLPALIAYVPLLLTQPGQVGADTKTYLYLDPARLLAGAPYLWDQNIGLGTITHQNIGYLWPMGPWYWLFETLGFPDWIAQRLWLGTVMFAAAMGVRYLLHTLGWSDRVRDHGVLIASLAYMLSPYLLDYSARISVILLPWAGLPWLIALTAKSLRHGGWRYPAWFALTMVTIGGVNATALIMVAAGPALWVLYAVFAEREVTGRATLAALGRMGALTLVTSLWWMAGLWAQGRYGLPVLRYTETYHTVAESSNAPEILRGLGYWFFYGRDKLGPWIEPSVEYTGRTALLALSYALPTMALAATAVVRWRHRAYFLLVLVVGALLAVGAHPWDNSSPFGSLFKSFTRTDAGLALRSTPRAVPLVVLPMAVFLGAGVSAVSRRLPSRALPVTALAGLLLLLNLPPLWNGTMVADNLKRAEDIPDYWIEAAAWLDDDDGTRVLEVPGSDFASYRWGNTVDPVTPGLLDRPYAARELFQYGTPASAGLMVALDRPMQEHLADPDAMAPVARLLGVGDIVLRADLQYERYRIARPTITWEMLTSAPGLDDPVAFGPATPNIAGPEQPLLDEIGLAADPDGPQPRPVVAFPVSDPLPIIRARSADRPLLLAGGPDGLVDAASAGLLVDDQAVFYAGSFAEDPEGLSELLAHDAELLVTDTNRKRAQRWGTIHQITGYTEEADEEPLTYDPTDQRLEIFTGADSASATVTEQRGPLTATASAYGNPVTFTPDDRPANAIDGDPLTAWRVGAFSDVTGERLILEFDQPTTADDVRLLQPVTGIRNRAITDVDLVFDGEERIRVMLDETSETEPGQVVPFEERTFSTLEIEVVETDFGRNRRYDGASAVGFAEVQIADSVAEEVVRPPTDLLDATGPDAIDHRLGYLFTRLRSNPQEKVRFDEEPVLKRAFEVPSDRSFSLTGEARLSGRVADELIDGLVGLPSAEEGGITARSDARLPGALRHRASAAIDGDPETFWMPPFDEQEGHWIELILPEETTIDRLDLEVVADGRHSVPTSVLLQADGDDEQVRRIPLGDVPDSEQENATVEVPVEFPELTGRTFRLTIDGVREARTIDWHSEFESVLPVGIAEVGIPGHLLEAPPIDFDSGCRDDLLDIDDVPVPIRFAGETEDLLDREGLPIQLCPAGPSGATEDADVTFLDGGVGLTSGDHLLRSSDGRRSGFDVDQVLLASEPGGTPARPDAPADPRPAPTITVGDRGRVTADVSISDAERPFWLVLGQSHSDGWTARVDGGPDLGEPILIDGYANGWYVDPSELGSSFDITIEWTPQRVIWIALLASALGIALCLVMALVAPRRPRRWESAPDRDQAPIRPRLDRPFQNDNVVFSQPVAIAAGLAAGLLALANSPPPGLVAIVVAGLTGVAFRWSRGRRLLPVAATLSLAAAGAYFVIGQFVYRHRPDFSWPGQFEAVHVLGLLAVFCLGVDAIRQLLAGRSRSGPSPIDP